MARPAVGRLVAAVAALALVTAPWWIGDDHLLRQLSAVAILALVVSGLNLSLGFGGEMALGQAAMYAAGAYTGAYLAANVTDDLLVCVVVASGVAVVLGTITGLPALRIGGWSLAVTSFFLVILIPDIVDLLREQLGGYDGMTVGLPTMFGSELDVAGTYLVVAVTALLWFVTFRNIVRSPWGVSLLSMRRSPVLAASLGLSPFRLKLTAYLLGALPAGAAGALSASVNGFVAPSEFGLELVVGLLAASIIGGPATVVGAVVGAFLLEFAHEQSARFESWATIGYGTLLLAGGVLLTRGGGGVVGLVRAWIRRHADSGTVRRSDAAAARQHEVLELSGSTIRIAGMRKTFGGTTALDGVDLELAAGRVTALIGPNGSGKTTALNLISGLSAPYDGDVIFDGRSVRGQSAMAIARRGVGRTFQTPAIPSILTVREVLESGELRRSRPPLAATILRTPGYRRRRAELTAEVDRVSRLLGLDHLLHATAEELPAGTRRLVELGRALLGRPSVLLLDEVASGLDEEELVDLKDVVGWLSSCGATTVLVEHNFAFVNEVADVVYVLAEGRVVAGGTPQEISSHPEVIEKYLGRGAMGIEQEAAP
ncbi:ABC transporter permease subunit [Pseudonocardia xishanensis]|uniref:branched-chain amino acid ABC transporter ATP-binding protein/permease n=1 Tax=Pseudonocardia xishanensis TaxID=630995 RepID=UPI0031EC5BD6